MMQFNRTTFWRSYRVLALVLVGSLTCGGCTSPSSRSQVQNEEPTLRHRIAVTNFPLFCAVKTICSQAESPVKEVIYCGPTKGSDPHTWIPSVDQIRDLQKVDLIVCNGPGAVFSTWLDKVTFDESKLVKTTDAIGLEEFVIVEDYQLVHSHGPEGEHSHSWVVPQSWLSPRIARKQAALCFQRIVEAYGERQSLEDGFAELQKKFDDLETGCKQLRDLKLDLAVVTSSPQASYLTRELDLIDRYLQLSDESSAADAEKMLAEMRARVIKQGSDNKPEALFLWVGQIVESLAPFAAQQWQTVVEIDLIETPTDGIDSAGYFERMENNLKVIRAAVE